MAFTPYTYGEAPSSITVKTRNEKINLSIKPTDDTENPRFEISRNGVFVAYAEQNSNLYAYKLFYDMDEYCSKIFSKPDSSWHKNIVHHNSDGDIGSSLYVINLAKNDTVIESNTTDTGHHTLSYLKSKNKEFVKSATGYDIIGMSQNQVEETFGTCQIMQENDIPRLVYSFYVEGESYKQIVMYPEDGRIYEVLFFNDPLGERRIQFGERSYFEGEVPAKWFTRGFVTGINVNVRNSPKTGEVIAKIGKEHPEVMFSEVEDTGEEYKWVHILTKYDESKGHIKPIKGWVYSKFISPSFKNVCKKDSFYNCYDYIEWESYAISEKPSSKTKSPKDENGNFFVTKTWDDLGFSITLMYIDEDNYSFSSFELTKDTYEFAGMKVGDGIEKVKLFDKDLKSINLNLPEDQQITDNAVICWSEDQNSDEIMGYLCKVELEIKDGKIVKIKGTRC